MVYKGLRTIASSNRTVAAMKPVTLAALLGLAVFLSGCDKCGNFGSLFGTSGAQSCGGKAAD